MNGFCVGCKFDKLHNAIAEARNSDIMIVQAAGEIALTAVESLPCLTGKPALLPNGGGEDHTGADVVEKCMHPVAYAVANMLGSAQLTAEIIETQQNAHANA